MRARGRLGRFAACGVVVAVAAAMGLVTVGSAAVKAAAPIRAAEICHAIARSEARKLLNGNEPTNSGSPQSDKVPTCAWSDAGGDTLSVSASAWTGAPFNCKGSEYSRIISGWTVCLDGNSDGEFSMAADRRGAYVEVFVEFNPSTGAAPPDVDDEDDTVDDIIKLDPETLSALAIGVRPLR